MFRTVGQLVVRWWAAILVVWLAVLVVASAAAPPLEDVVQSGEFAFLPPDSPSRIAEEIFAKAFPDDLLASGLAIVVRRASHHDGLQ